MSQVYPELPGTPGIEDRRTVRTPDGGEWAPTGGHSRKLGDLNGTLKSFRTRISQKDELSDDGDDSGEHMFKPDEEVELTEKLEMIKTMMKEAEVTAMDAEPSYDIVLSMEYEFPYKNRPCSGKALHIAALLKSGEPVLRQLLEAKADANEPYTFKAFGTPAQAQALHLAAGCGNIETLSTLLDKDANIEVRSKHGDDDHYMAIHEAAFMSQIEAVNLLIARGADPGPRNRDGRTPMHLAAIRGSWKVANALVEAKASVDVKDRQKSTALMLACDHGLFPRPKLYMLCKRRMQDILLVAGRNPSAASELLCDHRKSEGGRRVVHKSWGEAIHELSDFTNLLELAPQAAEDLLNSVKVTPPVQEPKIHPLPRRAKFPLDWDLSCYYISDKEWACDRGGGNVPAWHKGLIPSLSDAATGGQYDIDDEGDDDNKRLDIGEVRDKAHEGFWQIVVKLVRIWRPSFSKQEDITVKVRMLKVPGLLRPEMLHALAHTTYLHLFSNIAVQAIVQCAWRGVVRNFYYTNLLYRIAEMLVLVFWVLLPPEDDLQKKFCWSVLTISSCRELFYECWEVFAYTFRLHRPWDYIGNVRNGCDITAIGLIVVLSVLTHHDQRIDRYPEITALVALSRWFALCYMFRAFPWAGRKIMPIINSFFPIGGIILITVLIFFGFLHAFLALEIADPQPDSMKVLLYTFRLLFTGDGDGIAAVLELGGAPAEGRPITRLFLFAAVTVFCVCVLNLFIAVHGEAYDAAQEKAVTTFLQERASICLQGFLRPHWPPRWGNRRLRPFKHPWTVAWAIVIVAAIGFLLLIWSDIVGLVLPTAVMLITLLFTDTVFLQRPWALKQCREGKLEDDTIHDNELFLWMCYPADYDPASFWPTEPDGGVDLPGRLVSIKKDGMLRHKRIQSEVVSVRSKFDLKSKDLAYEIEDVGFQVKKLEEDACQRLERLEGTLSKLVLELNASRPAAPRELAEAAPGIGIAGTLGAGSLGAMSPVKASGPTGGHLDELDRSVEALVAELREARSSGDESC